MEVILQPWPWYVSGVLIALVMFILLMMGDRFGMSSNLRTLCTICGAGKKTAFFSVQLEITKMEPFSGFRCCIRRFYCR